MSTFRCRVTLIATGSYNGGSRRCWGFNASGELGNSTTIHSLIPAGIQQPKKGPSLLPSPATSSHAQTKW
jgi:hypothetical protein